MGAMNRLLAPLALVLMAGCSSYSVKQQLQAKGYRLETKADPDFLIAYYPILPRRAGPAGAFPAKIILKA